MNWKYALTEEDLQEFGYEYRETQTDALEMLTKFARWLAQPATMWIAMITLLSYPFEYSIPDRFFALWPIGSENFYPWQLLTYLFLHKDWSHVAGNMALFILFGPIVERAIGVHCYIGLYLLSGVAGGLLVAFTGELGLEYPQEGTIGASGAVFGIVVASMFFMRSWTLRIFIGWLIYFVITDEYALLLHPKIEDLVSHAGHIGGMFGGMIGAMTLRSIEFCKYILKRMHERSLVVISSS